MPRVECLLLGIRTWTHNPHSEHGSGLMLTSRRARASGGPSRRALGPNPQSLFLGHLLWSVGQCGSIRIFFFSMKILLLINFHVWGTVKWLKDSRGSRLGRKSPTLMSHFRRLRPCLIISWFCAIQLNLLNQFFHLLNRGDFCYFIDQFLHVEGPNHETSTNMILNRRKASFTNIPQRHRALRICPVRCDAGPER